MHRPGDLRTSLRSALRPPPATPPPSDLVPAGVLVPLIDEEEPALMFTRRADSLPRHGGEISFPGGLCHADDPDLVATALRETEEELGLSPGLVEVLGVLDPVPTHVSGILIVPVVGVLATRPAVTPSPAEIAEVLEYRVADLARVEEELAYRHEHGTWFGFAYVLDGHTIWGATGRIVHAFLDLVRKETPWVMGGDRPGPATRS
jgi:8-oxo-dGTP pyrophosphatase MutT (NUDIX family)